MIRSFPAGRLDHIEGGAPLALVRGSSSNFFHVRPMDPTPGLAKIEPLEMGVAEGDVDKVHQGVELLTQLERVFTSVELAMTLEVIYRLLGANVFIEFLLKEP